jgi:hypothetical protein
VLSNFHLFLLSVGRYHSWASALRKLMPASTFRHRHSGIHNFSPVPYPKSRQGHAAWARIYSMDTDLYHGHGHAEWTLTWTCSIEMDIQHGHGHAAWTWTRSLGLVMQHGLGQTAWTWTMDMHHRCQNAHQKFSLASLVFR